MAEKKDHEKLIAKVLEKNAGPLVSLLPAPLFDTMLEICRTYLERTHCDQTSLATVAKMALMYRRETFLRFGHDSVETFALGKLLGAQTAGASKKGRLDALSYVAAYPNRMDRLDVEQVTAAEYIIKVWEAFSKFRNTGARGFEGSGRSGQVRHPLDVMGDELWDHYKAIYVPWYNVASRVTLHRLTAGPAVSLAAVVYRVVVADEYPEQVDAGLALPAGMALRGLKAALAAYGQPNRLYLWGRAPRQALSTQPQASPQPQATPPAIQPASGVKTALRGAVKKAAP